MAIPVDGHLLLLGGVRTKPTQSLYIGYHGTNAVTPTFAPELGAFFASAPATSASYGKNVTAHRLWMENPAQWSPDLVDGFQEYVFNRLNDGFTQNEVEQFRANSVRVGGDPEKAEEDLDGYAKALLTQPARRITFSDTDPLFGLLRTYLLEQGHDGLLRPHETSDNRPDGSMEFIPFHSHQIAPLLSPDAPAAFAKTKLKDGAGLPLVVYRGEQSGERFERFDRSRTRERGFFFTPQRGVAAGYDRDEDPRAFVIAAERVLDLTRDTPANRRWVDNWGKSFDSWVDRASGENIDPFTVLEGGRLFDYEGNWSSERWRDIQASAEADGYDAVVLPDYCGKAGVFPAVVAFRPEQIWEIKPPSPGKEPLEGDRALLRGLEHLPAPSVSAAAPGMAAPEPA